MENAIQTTPRGGIDRARRDDGQTNDTTRIVEIRPPIDVLESDGTYRILADVPGVEASGADVRIEMPHLRIAAMRPARGGVSIRYAATIVLPATIDAGSLAAEIRSGVLEITMTKSAAARPRRIEVRAS